MLALGMLTAIRKTFALLEWHEGRPLTMAGLPQEDPAVYEMLCRADSVGVFQVESRAQMAMLPRLKPCTFYDLVVQVAIAPPAPLLGALERDTKSNLHDGVTRPAPSVVMEVIQDYDATGLTLKAHPMQLLRADPRFHRCLRAIDLPHLNHGRFVRMAGVVTGRQRPGTAQGIIFLTLEDETGNTNVVVKTDVQDRCRKALLQSRIALIKGTVENREGVVHVLAGQIEDVSDALAGLAAGSRDFH